MKKLFRVPAVRINSRVGSVRDLHAGAHSFLKIFALQTSDQSFFLHNFFRRSEFCVLGENVIVVVNIGGEICAAFFHHSNSFIVDQASVFDGSDAGANRHLYRFGSVGVCADFYSVKARFIHDRVHFLLRILRRADARFFAQNSRARAKLDHIRAILYQIANLLAHFIHAIRDARHFLRHFPIEPRRESIQIAMASGRADVISRRENSRTGNFAAVYRIAQRDVNKTFRAETAHGRKTRIERALRIYVRGDGFINHRATENRVVIISAGLARDVHMRIREPGQNGRIRKINNFRARGNRDIRADCLDHLALDQNQLILEHATDCDINHPTGFDHSDGRRSRRVWCLRID